MSGIDPTPVNAFSPDSRDGAEAARLIWDDDAAADDIRDPRTPEFARAMINTAVAILRDSRGLLKKMIGRAAAAAGDLAVAQFQGLVEVIQNADDVRATEVRFALRETKTIRQLLVVHNGQPVTCHNVLGMVLPFLTTKTERRDQRGRFGIGLKTLKRIATSVAVHSAPYHFSVDQLHFDWVEPEPALPGFYDPQIDTMLVLDLREAFDEVELRDWFDAWGDEGLLFLDWVCSFRWCDLSGATIAERTLEFEPWIDAGCADLHKGVVALMTRRVLGPEDSWTVWRATVTVPTDLHPAHKARSETTDISVATAEGDSKPTLNIGFNTPVPVTLPFSLDAQFDPATSREAIIQNSWNDWLIDCSAEVVGDIAAGLLAGDPVRAWPLIPLGSEGIGVDDGGWIHRKFGSAFQSMRAGLARSGALALGAETVALCDLAYEHEDLADLLTPTDIEVLAPGARALSTGVRDANERWRAVLDQLGVSRVVGTNELLSGFDKGVFAEKLPGWWVEAGARLVACHPDEELFGPPFLLSEEGTALNCQPSGATQRPIVFGAPTSAFGALGTAEAAARGVRPQRCRQESAELAHRQCCIHERCRRRDGTRGFR
jgi:hypothetical protein